ncbi:MAG TPA: endonuclease [Rhodothermales bacterium]|nr:endonuclease [Rhodothermales bacterium]
MPRPDDGRPTGHRHPSFMPFRACRAALLAVLLGVIAPAPPAHAQASTSLCPGLGGTALLACLRTGYTPRTVYIYDRARDTLFAYVDDGDRAKITDVYAGRTLAIPPGMDPTIAGCNGDSDGNASSCNGALNFNTEHAYPQSKGTGSGPARSDLHHLYPARADANSSRGNLPYGDFADASGTKFFRGTDTATCPAGCPPAEPDTWSVTSTSTGRFRPRAEVRGDLARSLFYVDTIYRAEADAADQAFFESMRATLLAWHRADPPDGAEVARSTRVRHHQGNDNPFVLDTSLAARAYAPITTGTPADAALSDRGGRLDLTGANPFVGVTHLVLHADAATDARVVVYDVLGRRVTTLFAGRVDAGTPLRLTVEAETWPPGAYVVRATGLRLHATRRLLVVQ